MKKLFKDWNLFEKIWLALLIILPIIFSIIFKSTIINCITTISYLLSAIFLAKGKVIAYASGIFGLILYGYVSFTVGYFGELIISGAILMPVMIYGLVNWFKNKRIDEKQGKVVVVKQVGKKEIAILLTSQIICGVGYYFLLKAFNTNFLFVSTISIVTSVIASYLVAKRSQYGLLAFLINDFVLVILWSSIIFQGNLSYITILLTPFMLLVSDFYGIFNWKKLKNSQEEN